MFPLQILGFDVDFINSVQFSNHTGYEKGVTGDVMNGEQLKQILRGLEDNGLLEGVTHLLVRTTWMLISNEREGPPLTS